MDQPKLSGLIFRMWMPRSRSSDESHVGKASRSAAKRCVFMIWYSPIISLRQPQPVAEPVDDDALRARRRAHVAGVGEVAPFRVAPLEEQVVVLDRKDAVALAVHAE